MVEFGVEKCVDPLRKEHCPVPMLIVGTGIFKPKPIAMAIAILSQGHGVQHKEPIYANNEVHPDYHDEIDIEFLGTIPGEPYTLQTNIYVRAGNVGSGRFVTGREQQIHLWFDPTKDFHRYSILWTPYKIVFSVDGVPIRKYPRTDASTFPTRPMWVYGSIWDASSWATDNGRYKVDYRYQPFVAKYTAFVLTDCTQSKAVECS